MSRITRSRSIPIRRGALAVMAAGALTALGAPAVAGASTIDMPGTGFSGNPEELRWTAAPGEDNFVVVREVQTPHGLDFTIQDAYPIQLTGDALSQCPYVTADKKKVQCEQEHDNVQELRLDLGDGKNFLQSFSGSVRMRAFAADGSANTMDGGPGKDILIGKDGADSLLGDTGEDELLGSGGNDSLHGGDGADVLVGGPGNDSFIGGRHADRISGSTGFDTVSYRDRLSPVVVTIDNNFNDGEANESDNVEGDVEGVEGGHASDTITDLVGIGNAFFGGDGADTLSGGGGSDSTLVGGAGADDIDGGAGADMLFGGVGNDHLAGGSDNDLVMGEADADTIQGGTGADNLSGGDSNDTVTYADANQRVTVDLDGATGDDGATGEQDTVRADVEHLIGSSASDTLTGNDAANSIRGGDGNDVIEGGLGGDLLFGGNDLDTLRSKDGTGDMLDCGADADQVDADDIDTKFGCEGVAAPAVGIGPSLVNVDASGRARLQLHCWATSAEHCAGRIRIEDASSGKPIAVGTKRMAVPSQDTKTVAIRLSPHARKVLAGRGRMRLQVVSWAKDASGFEWKSAKTLTFVD